jgi:hypothetical protein
VILIFPLTRHSLPISKMLLLTTATFLSLIHSVTATTNVTSRTAPVGAKVLTVAVIGGLYARFRVNSDIDVISRLWMDRLGSIT